MDHGRGQAQTRVVVRVVVPLKEGLAKVARIFDGAEAIRETRAVFKGAELAFRIRIVVGDMRTGMRFGNTRSARSKATGVDFIDDPRFGVYRELSRCERCVAPADCAVSHQGEAGFAGESVYPLR